MGFISPITNLVPLPTARPVHAALEPPPMERAESSARSGDETYSPSEGESSGGEDANPEGAEVEFKFEEASEEPTAPELSKPDESGPDKTISFFA